MSNRFYRTKEGHDQIATLTARIAELEADKKSMKFALELKADEIRDLKKFLEISDGHWERLEAENARLLRKVLLSEAVETLCRSPAIEILSPRTSDLVLCNTVQDVYDMMRERLRRAAATLNKETEAGS